MREPTGVRAITLQQPYAAAVASGVCRYTRRGKETKFANGSEWVAIHCGSNNVHLKNRKTMEAIRRNWPECPDNVELKAGQKHILGFARFVGCCPANASGPKSCPFMKVYDCSKPFCWEADAGVTLKTPILYPKGNLQIWNLYDDGFTNAAEGGAFFRKLMSSMTSEFVSDSDSQKKKNVMRSATNHSKVKVEISCSKKIEDSKIQIDITNVNSEGKRECRKSAKKRKVKDFPGSSLHTEISTRSRRRTRIKTELK